MCGRLLRPWSPSPELPQGSPADPWPYKSPMALARTSCLTARLSARGQARSRAGVAGLARVIWSRAAPATRCCMFLVGPHNLTHLARGRQRGSASHPQISAIAGFRLVPAQVILTPRHRPLRPTKSVPQLLEKIGENPPLCRKSLPPNLRTWGPMPHPSHEGGGLPKARPILANRQRGVVGLQQAASVEGEVPPAIPHN
jgi:hypothetical protein